MVATSIDAGVSCSRFELLLDRDTLERWLVDLNRERARIDRQLAHVKELLNLEKIADKAIPANQSAAAKVYVGSKQVPFGELKHRAADVAAEYLKERGYPALRTQIYEAVVAAGYGSGGARPLDAFQNDVLLRDPRFVSKKRGLYGLVEWEDWKWGNYSARQIRNAEVSNRPDLVEREMTALRNKALGMEQKGKRKPKEE